ncbi:hypothetical protein MP638_004994 [Amoeboaphelidium occidentale]|nr:hypothetical protein MP638_004994 [Amoeboaphelidium occidentale]
MNKGPAQSTTSQTNTSGVVTVSLINFVWAIVTLSTVCGAIVLIAVGDLVAMVFAIQGNLAYYALKFNLIWFGIEAIFIATTCIRAAFCNFNVVWAFIDIALWVALLLVRGYYYLAIRKATAVA